MNKEQSFYRNVKFLHTYSVILCIVYVQIEITMEIQFICQHTCPYATLSIEHGLRVATTAFYCPPQ